MAKKGGKTTTNTTELDPASRAYLEAQRGQAAQGANTALQLNPFTGPQTQSIGDQAAAFMNPYTQNVIGAVNTQFDKARAQATVGTNQQATMAGAFGGSRQGVAQGTRLGELDATQQGINANLLQSGYNNALTMGTDYAERQRQLQEQKNMTPLWQAQQAQGMLTGGYGGPTGSTQTTVSPGQSILGQVAGAAQTALGVYTGLKGAGVIGKPNTAGGIDQSTPNLWAGQNNYQQNRFQPMWPTGMRY